MSNDSHVVFFALTSSIWAYLASAALVSSAALATYKSPTAVTTLASAVVLLVVAVVRAVEALSNVTIAASEVVLAASLSGVFSSLQV